MFVFASVPGCIVHDCESALKLCMKQITKDVFADSKSVIEITEKYTGLYLSSFNWCSSKFGKYYRKSVTVGLLPILLSQVLA